MLAAPVRWRRKPWGPNPPTDLFSDDECESEEPYARQKSLKRHELCYVHRVEQLVVSSSWIVGHGDVIEMNARSLSGRKLKPRKKRGKRISAAAQLDQLQKIADARDRRRGGFKTHPGD
jgi:hypothetical protein